MMILVALMMQSGKIPIGTDTAKGLLKAELKRRNMSYADLVEKLSEMNIVETEANIRNKLSRGTFTAAFFIQCLIAIGCEQVVFVKPKLLNQSTDQKVVADGA
jgi:hypothetical protein